MAAIFSKNCILKGQVDLYCLVCGVYLLAEDDALLHTQDSKHNQIMKSIGYFASYEQDFIRKVNSIYFCEVCNVTLSTATKVKSHVAEEAHRSGRGHMMRCSSGGVRCGRVAVADDAWHGLVAHTCVLCDVDNCDVTHTQHRAHVLNLIHSRVIVGPNNDVYRKMDEFYQCLTCNNMIPEQLISDHLSSEDHKKILLKASQTDEANTNQQKNNTEEKNADNQENTNKDIQPQDNTNSNSNFRVKEKIEKEISSNSVPKILETFALQHGLIIKDNIVHCEICSTQILAILEGVKEHVHSKKHSDNKAQHTTKIQMEKNKQKVSNFEKLKKQEPKNIAKVKCDQFFTIGQIVFADDSEYFIVNESLCINTHSFMGLTQINNVFICRICDIDLTLDIVPIHIETEQHKRLNSNSFIITSLKGEFVRQIKTDKYDCGYCNKIEKNFQDMLAHLSTAEHKRCKSEHENKFKKFKLLISQDRIPHINLTNITNRDEFILRSIGLFDDFKI